MMTFMNFIFVTFTIFLYLSTAWFSIHVFKEVDHAHELKDLRTYLRIFLGLNAFIALLFVYVQVVWSILYQHVHLEYFSVWVAFNILNAIAHLTFIQAIHVYLEWRSKNNRTNRRRRRDD